MSEGGMRGVAMPLPYTTQKPARRPDIRGNAREFNGLEGSASLGGAVQGPEMVGGGVEVPLAISGSLLFPRPCPIEERAEGVMCTTLVNKVA
jgi:hypothetical protein